MFSSISSNSHTKSKVWDYFTKPYGPPQSRKTKCHECGNEFSYHGSTSSLKYHLKNRHKIDMSTNLSQVNRQSQQIPSQQSNFSLYPEPSFSENKNSSLQSSTVWDYFTKPYGPPQSRKTKCHECGNEFSYHGSTSSLKYHLKNRHMSINLRQSQQIPSQQSNFSLYPEPSFSENKNSSLQSSTISLANKKNKVWDYFTKPSSSSNHGSPSSLKYHLIHLHNIDMSTNSVDQIQNQNQPLNLQLQNLEQKNADILTAEEGFFTVLNKLLETNRNDKGNKDALIIRGKFYRKMGIYEESTADLNKVLEIEPNNVKVLISKGKVYKKMGKYEESITNLSRALEIEPNNVKVLISKGKAYKKMGKYEESITYFSRALGIEPNNVNALKSRGDAYYRIGEYEKSIADSRD
ncbi:hypothetical protein Glove_169g66 [Diversispora epigaea]|uniref:BED-type domain-containing protein n=1 Tax=Diversispora epigaea TaxID=1348612 RepID=A0A397ISY5_9GLOM|nr:hypothetical protein Glove_169g66 [Diversispora epigaea]